MISPKINVFSISKTKNLKFLSEMFLFQRKVLWARTNTKIFWNIVFLLFLWFIKNIILSKSVPKQHFLVFYRFWKSSKRWFCRQIRLVKYSYTFGKCSKSVFWECFYKKHENKKLFYFKKKLFFAWINAARKLLYVYILLGFSLFVKYFLFFAFKKVFSLRKKTVTCRQNVTLPKENRISYGTEKRAFKKCL